MRMRKTVKEMYCMNPDQTPASKKEKNLECKQKKKTKEIMNRYKMVLCRRETNPNP
jgi:hypothetical protein